MLSLIYPTHKMHSITELPTLWTLVKYCNSHIACDLSPISESLHHLECLSGELCILESDVMKETDETLKVGKVMKIHHEKISENDSVM